MTNDKLLSSLTFILFALGISTMGYVVYTAYFRDSSQVAQVKQGCIEATLTKSMSDKFMTGIVNKGQQFKVLKGYYNCNDVIRDDLVYYRISAPIEPVVKIVKGIPGDTYEVTRRPQSDIWDIRINGQLATVSGQNYYIESKADPPLRTYQISRDGVLGKDEYIILSSVVPGRSDSGKFGLIKKKDFVGKVVLGSMQGQ